MKTKLLIFSWFLAILVLLPVGLLAQSPVADNNLTEETLEQFVLALIDVQEVQVEMNNQVEGIMQGADLEPQRLIEIHQTLSQGLSGDSFSQEEIAVYEVTMEEIAQVEQQAQIVMIQVVEENGITVDQYNQIIALAQQDPEFMEMLQQLIASMSS